MNSQALRACIYVDGLNLFYRALRGTPYRWLDISTLSANFLGPQYEITGLRYFSAPVVGTQGRGSYDRQQQYLNALRSIPNLEIHLGSFMTHVKRCRLQDPLPDGTTHVRILQQEEKGTDVNLASYLLHDAWQDKYDAALIYSQDTDLLEPLRLVRRDLGKSIGVVVLDGKRPGKLAQSGNFQHHITTARLAAAQFPYKVSFGRKGKIATCPIEWREHPVS